MKTLVDVISEKELSKMCPCQILAFIQNVDRDLLSESKFNLWFEKFNDYRRYSAIYDHKTVKMNCVSKEYTIFDRNSNEYSQYAYDIGRLAYKTRKINDFTVARQVNPYLTEYSKSDDWWHEKGEGTNEIDEVETLNPERFASENNDGLHPDHLYYKEWVQKTYKDKYKSKDELEALLKEQSMIDAYIEFLKGLIKQYKEMASKSLIKVEHYDTIEECQKNCPMICGFGVNDILFGSGVVKLHKDFKNKYPNLIELIEEQLHKEQDVKVKYLEYRQKIYDLKTLDSIKLIDSVRCDDLIKRLNDSLDSELNKELFEIQQTIDTMCMNALKGKQISDSKTFTTLSGESRLGHD